MIFDIRDLPRNGTISLSFDESVSVPNGYGLTNDLLDIRVEGEISKLKDFYYFEGTVSTNLTFECANCLDEVSKTISFSFSEKFSNNPDETSDEVFLIQKDKIDFKDILSMNLVLNIPPKVVCKDDCKGLCPSCGKNLNLGDCSCDLRPIDTRFLELYSLFENKEV